MNATMPVNSLASGVQAQALDPSKELHERVLSVLMRVLNPAWKNYLDLLLRRLESAPVVLKVDEKTPSNVPQGSMGVYGGSSDPQGLCFATFRALKKANPEETEFFLFFSGGPKNASCTVVKTKQASLEDGNLEGGNSTPLLQAVQSLIGDCHSTYCLPVAEKTQKFVKVYDCLKEMLGKEQLEIEASMKKLGLPEQLTNIRLETNQREKSLHILALLNDWKPEERGNFLSLRDGFGCLFRLMPRVQNLGMRNNSALFVGKGNDGKFFVSFHQEGVSTAGNRLEIASPAFLKKFFDDVVNCKDPDYTLAVGNDSQEWRAQRFDGTVSRAKELLSQAQLLLKSCEIAPPNCELDPQQVSRARAAYIAKGAKEESKSPQKLGRGDG